MSLLFLFILVRYSLNSDYFYPQLKSELMDFEFIKIDLSTDLNSNKFIFNVILN